MQFYLIAGSGGKIRDLGSISFIAHVPWERGNQGQTVRSSVSLEQSCAEGSCPMAHIVQAKMSASELWTQGRWGSCRGRFAEEN